MLFLFGGEVIRGFSFAMIWGIVVGTYSSIWVASSLLLYFGVRRAMAAEQEEKATGKAAP
jgi:preprotein translocase subunit SecF